MATLCIFVSRFFSSSFPIALGLALIMIGCQQQSVDEDDDDSAGSTAEMILTFNQLFFTSELCFDLNTDEVDDEISEKAENEQPVTDWVQGCARDVELTLDVVDGEIREDSSSMTMWGSDSLVIDGLLYGPAVTQTAPMVGDIHPYGSPYGPCFAGRPHHPSEEISVWLQVWGGYTQRDLHVAVRLGEVTEAYGVFQVVDPLDPAFSLDSDLKDETGHCGPTPAMLWSMGIGG